MLTLVRLGHLTVPDHGSCVLEKGDTIFGYRIPLVASESPRELHG